MKQIIVLNLLVVLLSKTNAQNFNIVSPNDTINRLYWSVKSVDGKIVSYAAAAQFYNTPVPYSNLSFTVRDYDGNVIRDTIIGDTSFSILSNFGHSYNNGYFGIPGSIRNVNQNTFNKMSAYVIREDLKKDYKLYVPVDSGCAGFSNNILYENENRIVMMAHAQQLNNLGTSSLRFFILDTLNTVLVNKTFTVNGKWLVCNSSHKFADNYYLTCIRMQNNNINDPTDLVIYKLDTLGNIVNTYQTTNGKWYGAVSSAVLPNGDFIIGGYYCKGYISSNALDGLWQQKYLARFDKNLNLIWRKTFGTVNAISEITKVMIASDSTIVGCGVDTHLEVANTDSIGHGAGCIFKFSLDGDSIWMHKYQGVDGEYGEINWMTNMDELPDGQGYVGCGYIDNYFPSYRRGWIFRTDANGCLDASCTDQVKEIVEEREDVGIVVSPNPASTLVNINYNLADNTHGLITIFSTKGAIFYQEAINRNSGSLQINATDFSAGLYWVKLITNDGKLYVKPLSILE